MNTFKKYLLLCFFWIRDSRIWLAQKSLELVLKFYRVTLLANYVEAKKLIQLELVPTYLVNKRRDEMSVMKEILETPGDKIEVPK